MNKFAQLQYGKVIYVYETELKKEELSTIFDPSIFWIDVTGLDCEVGYVSRFSPDRGVILVPPENVQLETKDQLEKAKEEKFRQLDTFFNRNTARVTSHAAGGHVSFKCDLETRVNLHNIISRMGNIDFEEEYPNGYPLRGIREGFEDLGEQTLYLEEEGLKMLLDDINHLIAQYNDLKWDYEDQIEEADSLEELDEIVFEEIETHVH